MSNDLTESMYRMVRVSVENVLKCVAFEWEDDGRPVVHLTGGNGAGKSSVLVAIQMALGGGKRVPEEVMRQGARTWRSEVVLKTADGGDETLTVVRTGRANTTGTLSVTTQTNTKIPSPQALLDMLVSSVALDPLLFLGAKPKDQQTMLMRATGIEFDEAAHQAEHKAHYESRTAINRDWSRVKAEATVLGDLTTARKVAAKVEIDIGDMAAQAEAAAQTNADIAVAGEILKTERHEVAMLMAKVEELMRDLSDKRKELDKAQEILVKQEAAFADMQIVDTGDLTQAVTEAQAHNREIAQAQACLAKWSEVDEWTAASEAETAAIVALALLKHKTLASAQMPVDGLEFSADGLLYNGVPLAQASTGESMTVAIRVAAAMHPQLRVLFIDEGSVLDDTHMKIVAEVAREQDLLVWINSVRTDRPGLLIEDGVCRGETPVAED